MPKGPWKPGLLAVWATTIAVATAACGSGSSPVPPRPVPTLTPASTAANAASPRLPLDAYALTGAQVAASEYLLFSAEKSCMAKQGFPDFLSSVSTDYVTRNAKIFQEYDSRLWGISDPAQAALYGYHLPPWAQAPGTAKVQTLADLPAAEQTALIGRGGSASGNVPAGGCVGQAEHEDAAAGLTSGATSPLVSQLQLKSFEQAKSDPRVLRAFAAWSACMRSSGLDYPNPFAPQFDMAGPVSALEIKTARTDVACKFKTGLLGVTYAVEAGYQNTLIDANAQALSRIQDQVRAEQRALASAERAHGTV
jgi:hypothetical protein